MNWETTEPVCNGNGMWSEVPISPTIRCSSPWALKTTVVQVYTAMVYIKSRIVSTWIKIKTCLCFINGINVVVCFFFVFFNCDDQKVTPASSAACRWGSTSWAACWCWLVPNIWQVGVFISLPPSMFLILSPSINMKWVNQGVGLASTRSPLKTGIWKKEPGNGHWPHFYSTVDPEATSVCSSWKPLENQEIKLKQQCYFSFLFFKKQTNLSPL